MRNPNKRVNVISLGMVDNKGQVVQEAGMLMRTTRSYAQQLVDNGTHTFTSKGKLKSFLNKDMKLYRNSKVLDKVDLKNKKAGHVIFTDEYTGKTYVGIKKKEVPVVMQSTKDIDPFTGKPKQVTVNQPRFELRIARFPVS